MTRYALLPAVLLLAAPARADDLAKDAEKLQGKWERTAPKGDGAMPGGAVRAVKEVAGDKETVTWYAADGAVVRSHRVTFKLSADGPVRVYTYSDGEVLAGPAKGMKMTGTGSYVYRIVGDEFVEIGGALVGDKYRPENPFIARWKRADAKPAKPVAVAGDLKAAQGAWAFVSQEADGQQVPADLLKPLVLTIEGDTFTVKLNGTVVESGTVTFDATQTPKRIDVTVTAGQGKGNTWVGIYKLDGDTHTVCIDPTGKKRPTEFNAPAGSGLFMNVHKRAK